MKKIQVEKRHTFSGHNGPVYALAKGTEEGMFYSAGADGFVARWHLETPQQGMLVARIPHSVYSLCPIPGTSLMAVGHNFEGIHLLASGKEEASLKLGNFPIFDMQVKGDLLFAACGEGRVFSIHWPSMTLAAQSQHSTQHARCLVLSDEALAVGYSDSHIRILDPANLSLRQDIAAHDNSLFSLAWEDFLLSGSRDAFLKIWKQKPDGEYALYASAPAHLYTINHIAFSPDGAYFATCSKDKSIKIWQKEEFKLIKVIDRVRHAGHGTSVNRLLWLNHSTLLSASDDRSISCWDIQWEVP